MNLIGVRKADQRKRVSKKAKQKQEEPEESGVKLNDLPGLPFDLILSYLSLQDRIKSRAISRRWYKVINSFRLKSLCLSERPSGFISEKNRWISGEFAKNFVSSTKFKQFFEVFNQSILANLKHLRLCELDLNAEITPESFVEILNSLGQLEELDLVDIDRSSELNGDSQVRLNLPMLKSIQLVWVRAIKDLTLNAPRLQKVKYLPAPKVDLVHGESVEKLVIDRLDDMEVSKMKNLKYLYCGAPSIIDPTLLSTLEQLKEIHLGSKKHVLDLFQQKKRYGRSNLKIFLFGFHLNSPDDPAIDCLYSPIERCLVYLAENPSKVAKEIPFYDRLRYSAIEAVAPGQEIDLLKRFTDLHSIIVDNPVQNVERFLEFLKNLNNIVELDFGRCDQPQQLFDRLPDHCAIQELVIEKTPADLNFLFRLKSLICLGFWLAIDIELVPRVLEELPFLLSFDFEYLKRRCVIEITIHHSKQFTIYFTHEEKTKLSDVNAVVQWIREKKMESR